MTASTKFDVIIYGASGCMGKSAVQQAVHIFKGLKWAIAGRSEPKLKEVLNEISEKTGITLTDISILLANVNNQNELDFLVTNCKVLVNCTGPHHLTAEQIITTCILKGTHYVDMCNDPYFNELMEMKYHEKAMEYKSYVISSCGFHSLPLEITVNFVQRKFEGIVNQVEAFVRYNFGYYFYYPLHAIWSDTSWRSLLWASSKIGELSFIRHELRTAVMPKLEPQIIIKELYHRTKAEGDGIMVHFPFIDQQVVDRSQYQCFAQDSTRPIQFCKYVEFPNFVWAVLFIIWCLVVSILSQFPKICKIMEDYPRIVSMGLFSPKGPNPYLLEMSSYKIKIHARGWSNEHESNQKSITADHNNEMNHSMSFEISGENPYYGCGCVAVLLSASTLLEESQNMPKSGGVYSPGFAFRNTKILEKLQNFQDYFRIKIL